ncbi:hypothetical protein TRIUR3_22183 [Triticum urartu]|uniref:Uncharacterized protein n=1 Tax=Triticum urartu TaxID=4572 RepID=M7Z7V7_TRIUA|nr:hypothetical protein TRIUR3_22183 [Triticum urartu]
MESSLRRCSGNAFATVHSPLENVTENFRGSPGDDREGREVEVLGFTMTLSLAGTTAAQMVSTTSMRMEITCYGLQMRLEETLINMYLSGYSNIEVNTENLLGESQISEEGKSDAVENKLSNVASDNASDSLNDATLQQIEDKMQIESFTVVHESLGEEEENWLSQYGQVERVNDELPLFPSVDLWDWHMVTEPVSKGQPMTRLVGRLTRGSSKLHPSLPARGGLLRTTPVREVHLDLVRVSSGKLYRLRNPSRKYLASLSAYDSSNPTKDWAFPDLYANPNNNSDKQSTACCLSDVAHESSTGEGVSAASGKEHKINTYRDRAAERRKLHRGLGIGPGQKQSNGMSSDEYEDAIEDMDSLGAGPVDMNLCSSGLKSAKRIMENMGWKEPTFLLPPEETYRVAEVVWIKILKDGFTCHFNIIYIFCAFPPET